MNIAKLRNALMSVAALGLLASGSAQASDNVTVTVNATIVGVCKFFTAAPVLNLTNTGNWQQHRPELGNERDGQCRDHLSLQQWNARLSSPYLPPRP